MKHALACLIALVSFLLVIAPFIIAIATMLALVSSGVSEYAINRTMDSLFSAYFPHGTCACMLGLAGLSLAAQID